MKAISVRQPGADLIMDGGKVDIRCWKTLHRGKLLIHASGIDWIECHRLGMDCRNFGALLGAAELVSVKLLSEEDWEKLRDRHLVAGPRPYRKTYGWFYRNPQRFSVPVPWGGILGLFEVSDEILSARQQSA